MTAKEILSGYDNLDTRGFSEDHLNSVLRAALPEGFQDLGTEMQSELMAFNFQEDRLDPNAGWGTYFGPCLVWNNGDGITRESPSIKLVTPEMIGYWEMRARESLNPIMIARYSGLVWDFQEEICGTKPNHEICRLYIHSLVDIALGDFHKYRVSCFTKLKRALALSISLNDHGLIDLCQEAIINFEDHFGEDLAPGLWGHSFDLLMGKPKIKLKDGNETKIINDLEGRLRRLTNPIGDQNKVDPWAAEAAAVRLADFYKRKQRTEDVKRVISIVGKAYFEICVGASAIQESGWLDHLYRLFNKFGLLDDAHKVLLRMRELGPKAASELQVIEESIEIPREKIEAFVKAMTAGSLYESLTLFAGRYIPDKKRVKEQLLDLSKNDPLQFLFTRQLLDDKGRLTATIGPLSQDLEGQLVHHISDSLYYTSPFLRFILEELTKRLDPTKKELLEFIVKSPIISVDKYNLIDRGIEAYLAKDFAVAIHLMIPQIEEAIRYLLELAGGNVLKPSTGGGFHLKTFDEVLRDPIVLQSLGEDFVDYFKILFTDQRGWNLRNTVCHGIANPNTYNVQTADRVFHALLCLGLISKNQKG
jgi:hypothetical protein